MSWSGYYPVSEGKAVNFNKDPTMFPDNSAKIMGVGCAGDKLGVDATKSVYDYDKEYVLKGGSRKKKYRGGGYSFTNEPIQIASPYSLYSVVESYNNRDNYRPVFPHQFKGGKRRSMVKSRKGRKSRKSKRSRKIQYGCSRRGSSHKGGKRHTKRKMVMKGGYLSSASDYTVGRDSSQDIPYGNEAISFGQGFDTTLGPNESGMATPTPLLPYNTCGGYRNK